MRTIKFRAKRHNGDWVYGDLLIKPNCFPAIRVYGALNEVADVAVTTETVGQFTGLFDKNGKEIYEGDILLFGETIRQKVEFFSGAFGYRLFDGSFIPYAGNSNFTFNPFCKDIKHEVIGNIYDNPELLTSDIISPIGAQQW